MGEASKNGEITKFVLITPGFFRSIRSQLLFRWYDLSLALKKIFDDHPVKINNNLSNI